MYNPIETTSYNQLLFISLLPVIYHHRTNRFIQIPSDYQLLQSHLSVITSYNQTNPSYYQYFIPFIPYIYIPHSVDYNPIYYYYNPIYPSYNKTNIWFLRPESCRALVSTAPMASTGMVVSTKGVTNSEMSTSHVETTAGWWRILSWVIARSSGFDMETTGNWCFFFD